MTTVIQATEQVLLETATAITTSVTATATAEFKNVESGIAQEAVSAADDDAGNLLDKVEGAVEIVAQEVVKGVEDAAGVVMAHPELIAEGALAVVVGVASLVQPELLAGEVAILGKMAADSAKKTVTQIASDEGAKIVKAISKDLTDDAKAEQLEDIAQSAAKKAIEGVVVAGKLPAETAPVIANAVPDVKNGLAQGPVVKAENTQNVPVAAVAVAAAATISSATVPAKESPGSQTVPSPAKDSIEQPSNLGMPVVPTPAANSSTPATQSIPVTTVAVAAATAIPTTSPPIKNSQTSQAEPPAPKSEMEFLSRPNALPLPAPTASIARPAPSTTSTTAQSAPDTKANGKADDPNKNTPEAQTEPIITKITTEQPSVASVSPVTALVADGSAPGGSSAVRLSTTQPASTPEASAVSADPAKAMVTVSQESLDLLHAKLDTMHEAILLITQHLAQSNTPAPLPKAADSAVAVPPISQEALPQISQPATAAQAPAKVIPQPKQVTQALSATIPDPTKTTDTAPSPASPFTPSSSQPTRPTPEKRTSMIGSLTNMLWPSTDPQSKVVVVKTSMKKSAISSASQHDNSIGGASSSKKSPPGKHARKAGSTVEVTAVAAAAVYRSSWEV